MSDSSTREDRIAAGCIQVVVFAVAILIVFGTMLGGSGSDSSSTSSDITWETYDVTIDVREDGSMRVREYQEITFNGSYSAGFVEIPMERIESIDNVAVSLERGATQERRQWSDPEPQGRLTEATQVAWESFDDEPNTFRARQEGELFLIDYAFDPVSWFGGDYVNKTRTVIVEYDAHGVIRDYPDAEEPWQQFHWMAISSDVTEIAPIESASVTINLPEEVPAEELVVAPEANSNDGHTITWALTSLNQGDSFDVQAAFPTITGATAPEWQPAADARDTSIEEREQRQNAGRFMLILAGIAIVVVGGLTMLYAWYQGIREPRVGPVHKEITDPPGDLPAVLVGSLLDEEVHPRDIAAGVLDLDRQGLITIRNGTESEPERYYLTLNRYIPARPAWIYEMLRTVFGDNAREGDTKGFSALGNLFGVDRHRLQHAIDQTLVDEGYYEELPETSRKHWTWVTYAFAGAGVVAAIAILVWARGWSWLAIVPPILGFALYWFGQKLTPHVAQKTRKGAETAALWRAFERHLNSTKWMISAETRAKRSEKYGPWIVAFGMEQGWLSEMNRPSWESAGSSGTRRAAESSWSWSWGDLGSPAPSSTTATQSSSDQPGGAGRSRLEPPTWRPMGGSWNAGSWRDMQSASNSVGDTLGSMSEGAFSMIGDMLESLGSSSGGGGSSRGGSSFRGSSSRSGGGRSRSSSGGGRRGFR